MFLSRFNPFFCLSGLLLLAVVALPTQAASKSHLAAAERVLELIQFEKQLSNTGNQVVLPIKQRLSMVRTSPEKAKLFRDHISAISNLVNEQLSWEKNKIEYIGVYAEIYSQNELNALVGFFSSDVGQKFISGNPELKQKIGAVTAANLQGLKPKLKAIEAELKEKLTKITEAEKKTP